MTCTSKSSAHVIKNKYQLNECKYKCNLILSTCNLIWLDLISYINFIKCSLVVKEKSKFLSLLWDQLQTIYEFEFATITSSETCQGNNLLQSWIQFWSADWMNFFVEDLNIFYRSSILKLKVLVWSRLYFQRTSS